MPSPFPGMDPFLEHPEIWPGFHHALAEELRRRLNRQIGPKYFADVDTYSVPHDIDLEITNRVQPDVGIFEPLDTAPEMLVETTSPAVSAPTLVRPAPLTYKLRAVRIYRTQTNQLVTSIEILSPYNKRGAGSAGIAEYRLKRAQLLASHVHLVEIDLLRGGERPGLEFVDDPIDTDYILLVNRFRLLERLSEIWPVTLDAPLPTIPIPLLPPDPDIALDLNVALQEVYASAGYDWRIDYQRPLPPPPLRPAVQAWVETLLASRAGTGDKR